MNSNGRLFKENSPQRGPNVAADPWLSPSSCGRGKGRIARRRALRTQTSRTQRPQSSQSSPVCQPLCSSWPLCEEKVFFGRISRIAFIRMQARGRAKQFHPMLPSLRDGPCLAVRGCRRVAPQPPANGCKPSGFGVRAPGHNAEYPPCRSLTVKKNWNAPPASAFQYFDGSQTAKAMILREGGQMFSFSLGEKAGMRGRRREGSRRAI
jgi:hypothetical protein